jgi:lysozyme
LKTPPRKTTAASYKAEIKKNAAVLKPPVKRKPAAGKKVKKRGYTSLRVAVVILILIIASPLYYRYIASGFTAAWHWINDIGEDSNYRHYKSFNIHVSEKYSIHGIDVSYAQGKIDWPQVKAMEENGLRISFVFIKATEGEQFVDSFYQRNWREAAKNGFICGAYHFFRPEKSGKLQAQLFLKTVKLEQNDLPPVVDIEKLDGISPEHMRVELNEFFSVMRHKSRVKPIIYSGLSFYRDYLKGHYDEYPLWIAHYDKPEDNVNAAGDWRFWQHSSKATVNGIHHAVDFDTFKGDTVAFRALLMH